MTNGGIRNVKILTGNVPERLKCLENLTDHDNVEQWFGATGQWLKFLDQVTSIHQAVGMSSPRLYIELPVNILDHHGQEMIYGVCKYVCNKMLFCIVHYTDCEPAKESSCYDNK
jgi:hypothetical protein